MGELDMGQRRSYGDLAQQATRAGYRTCLSYDLDSLDFTDPGAAAVRHNVAAQIRNPGRSGCTSSVPA